MASFPWSTVPDKLSEDEEAASFMEDLRKLASALQILGDGIIWRAGDGSPEGVITARPGSLFSRKDGPPTLYVKETGIGSNGWVGK